MGTQNDGKPSSALHIMRQKNFQAGFRDARAGRPFNIDAHQENGDRWGYERGRQFAALYPEVRTLNADAVELLERAFCNRDILPW
jgi:hypothetical protein